MEEATKDYYTELLKYIKTTPGKTKEEIFAHLNTVEISGCLDELSASKFIEIANQVQYYIYPFGDHILLNYPDYLSFKEANLIPYNALDFKNELEELLKSNLYTAVNIMPLIRKYTFCKDMHTVSEIRVNMREILRDFKNAGYIDYLSNIEGMCTKTRNQHEYLDLNIKSKLSFEEY